jgi:AcrR family transcriptional regulator
MGTKGRAPSEGTAPNGLRAGRNPQPGTGGLGAEQVSEIQRARIIAAMTEVACERGASNVTVAHVVERAGVSRRTFYELFDDREDCFVAAFEQALRRAAELVLPAYRAEGRWSERIRAALVALLEFLDGEPVMGLLLVGPPGAGTLALERRRRVLAHVIAAVDEGRTLKGIAKGHAASERSKPAAGPPPLTAEGIVGGALSILHARLSEQSPGSLLELTNPLMSMIVLPYLGAAAARRELERPAPRRRAPVPSANGNPLRELQMRLTYRTVRVLLAVAARPGGSNRQVADAAGITDQGQISKLLGRLQGLGLIENTGAGSVRGAPNAWVLTAKGWEVETAITHDTQVGEGS